MGSQIDISKIKVIDGPKIPVPVIDLSGTVPPPKKRVCRECNTELTSENTYPGVGRICRDCKNRARRPLTIKQETSADSSLTESFTFDSKKEKHEFVFGRRGQAKFSSPKIPYSSYVNQEAGACSECGGTVRRDSRNYPCCEDCGLAQDDEYNVVENYGLHVKSERKNQKYLNMVPRKEEAYDEDAGTYDIYYAECYNGR